MAKIRMFVPGTLAYADDRPVWHGYGTPVPHGMDSKTAYKEGGLDYEVAVGPVYGPDREPIEGRACTYRKDTGHVFGFVTPKYVPIQNSRPFEFMDELQKERVMHYETVGSFDDGAIVWVLAKLEQGDMINGEEYNGYLFAANAHDGSMAFHINWTQERVVCRNTFEVAIGSNVLKTRIVHKSTADARIDAARQVYQISTDKARVMHDYLESLAGITIEVPVLEAVREVLIGAVPEEKDPKEKGSTKGMTQYQNRMEAFDLVYGEEVDLNGPSAYSLFNATTGYVEHSMALREKSNKAQQVLMPTGRLAVLKQRALATLAKGIELPLPA